jgi:hypothetical protein
MKLIQRPRSCIGGFGVFYGQVQLDLRMKMRAHATTQHRDVFCVLVGLENTLQTPDREDEIARSKAWEMPRTAGNLDYQLTLFTEISKWSSLGTRLRVFPHSISPHSSPTAPSIQNLTHTLSTHRSSLPPSLTIDTDTSWTTPSLNAYRLVIHILYCQLEVMLYRHTQLHPHLQQSLPRDVMARRLENTLVTAGELVRRVVRLDLVGWMPGFMYVLFPLPLPYLISRVNKDLTNK